MVQKETPKTVSESNIKPKTNANDQESTLETDREITDRVPETEEPVYDPDRGSEEVRRAGAPSK